MGVHSYSDSPKYNKITENFCNRPPLLLLNFWQCDEKLNVVIEILKTSVVLIWLLIDIDMCFFLFIDQQIANKVWFYFQSWLFLFCIFQLWCRSKLEVELYIIFWLLQKIVTEMTRDHWFGIFEKNDDKWHIIKNRSNIRLSS